MYICIVESEVEILKNIMKNKCTGTWAGIISPDH